MTNLALGLSDLFRWDPFTDNPTTTFQRYYDTAERRFTPRFEVRETADALVLKADLPGVKTDDLDVEIHGNVLTVSGEREQDNVTDQEQVHFVERHFGSFSRAFTVPEGIDAKNLAAELRDGVLTVTLPKGPEAKPHKIEIKVSK
jgi:HSP20 family protein